MIKIPQVWQLSQCHLEFGFLCSCSEIKYLKNDGVPARYSTNTQTLFNGHFSQELRLTVLSYLSDLCRRVSTLLSRRRLHSVARGDLVINMSISGFGEHSFSAAAPKAWNELSDSLQSIRTRDLTGMEIVPIPTPPRKVCPRPRMSRPHHVVPHPRGWSAHLMSALTRL